jgi:O-antigen ligase
MWHSRSCRFIRSLKFDMSINSIDNKHDVKWQASETSVNAPLIAEASIKPFDIMLLLAMWAVVFVASIKNYGYLPAGIFLLLNIVLVARSNINGLLVLLLIFYSPAITLGIPNIFICSTAILLFRYMIYDFIKRIRGVGERLSLFYVVAVFVAYLALTLVYAPDLNLAWKYYSKYLEGAFLLFIFSYLVDTRQKLSVFLKWWAIAAGLALFLKLIHMHLGDSSYLYQLMKPLVRQDFTLDKRLTILVSGKVASRFIMPGEEPNYVSAGLIFPFALSLAFSIAARRWNKIFWLTIAILIWISIVGTYSRSGFLATVLVLGVFLLRNNLRAIIPSGIIFIAFVKLVEYVPQLHDRIFGIGSSIKGGASGRYYLWNLAFGSWQDSPIFGKGFSFFYYTFHDAAHSTYVQLLAETGLIGLFLFVSIIFLSLLFGFKIKKLYADKKNLDIAFSRTIIAGLVGISFLIGTVTYQDIKLYWLACGVLATMYLVTRNELKRKGAAAANFNNPMA